MRNGFTKKLTAIAIALLLIFSLAACGGDPSDDGSDVKTINVTLSILYPGDSHKESVEGYAMNIQDKATIMQILESYADQQSVAITVDTSASPYVTSINGVKAKGSSGWVFEVNDKSITKGASECKVKNGDKIVWKYVTF